MENNKFTPSTIGENKFTIPLYQRLFEWEEEQVNQLMQDLHASFKEHKENPYYIGVLTVFKDVAQGRYSLVDGQQRFTVLMLLSAVLGWEDFSIENKELRLIFFARKNDEEYLSAKIKNLNTEAYTNSKMDVAIITIRSFLEKEVAKDKLEEFKKYIKEQTTFFISELPQDYTPTELNRYFEAMNEAGKGLENHEILKVELLKKLRKEDFDYCTKIWNEVSQMDKCLIRQKENDSTQGYRTINYDAFKKPDSIIELGGANDQDIKTSIATIQASNKRPEDSSRNRDDGAILDFQEFLLLVLGLTVDEEISFDKSKLLATFENALKMKEKEVDIKPFFDNLLKYRLLFDYFVIRTTSIDSRTTTYTLNYFDDKEQSKQALIHYQSMLYVSISFNIWLKPLLKELDEKKETKFNDFKFLEYLKSWDNDRLSVDINLNYGSINRYWFWRLDYYLWENRDKQFDEISKKIANNYTFRANRSIEHIAPQTPKGESKVQLNENILHSFGNLAMISSGQNSSLQNASYEVKKAHTESFVNESVGGSIESLKLLKILEYEIWNEDQVKKHGNDMIEVLIKSFKNEEIKETLKNIKYYHHANI